MTAAAPSSKRIEANRRNAQKSTGPRTSEGKDRVRLNALKHGLTASTAVLPGEDAEALQSRVEAWRDDLEPRSAMEAYLVERAAHVSWQLDRADRTIAARLSDQMRHHRTDRETREADEVADLAARLFWDPRGAIGLYPHYDTLGPPPRISTPASPDDPLNPARIVNRLEATALGCRWLLDRWGDLRKILEDGKKWTAPDRLRAVRLLGAQPMDAIANDDVMSIYLACQAMDPQAKHAFADLCSELEVGVERVQYMEHVAARGYSLQPETPEGGQLALLELVARSVTRLEALLRVHDERQSPDRPGRLDSLAFDDSDEGERLRRYQLAHGRILLRTVSTIFKVRKEIEDLRDLTADVEAGAPPSLYAPSILPCEDIVTRSRRPPRPDPTLPTVEAPADPVGSRVAGTRRGRVRRRCGDGPLANWRNKPNSRRGSPGATARPLLGGPARRARDRFRAADRVNGPTQQPGRREVPPPRRVPRVPAVAGPDPDRAGDAPGGDRRTVAAPRPGSLRPRGIALTLAIAFEAGL